MSKTSLNVQLVTPERVVLEDTIHALTCPTTDGQITILPGHTPLVATLISGELVAKNTTKTYNLHVAGGFLFVNKDDSVKILADVAEHDYEIDIAQAEQAKLQAETTIKEQKLSDEEYALVFLNLQRNLSRLRIAKKHANRKTSITSEGVFHD